MGKEVLETGPKNRLKFADRRQNPYAWNDKNPDDAWDQLVKKYPSIAAEHPGIELEAHDPGPLLPVEVDMASKHASNQRLAKEAMRTADLVPTQDTDGYPPPASIDSPNHRSGNLQEWNGGTGGHATNDPPKV